MRYDKPFESALGFFWPEGQPELKMPGRLTIDGFPQLSVFSVGLKSKIPGNHRQTLYGVTDRGDYISLYGCLGRSGFWNKGSLQDDAISKEFRFGNRVAFTANYMLIGDTIHSEEEMVSKLSFTSGAIEHFYNLNANSTLEKLRFRKSKWDHNVLFPLNIRQFRSAISHDANLRIRIFASTLPNESDKPKTRVQIDFLTPVLIQNALNQLINLRELFSVLCNEYIDVQDILAMHRHENSFHISRMMFYNEKGTYTKQSSIATPMINISESAETFPRLIRNWASEDQRFKIARRAFVSTIQDLSMVKVSDLRELVTVLEMIAKQKSKPIDQPKFRLLRKKLEKVLDDEISADAENSVGLNAIREKLLYLNEPSAKSAIVSLIESIPEQLRKDIVADATKVVSEIVSLRNAVTHDLSRLTEESYIKANRMIHILRWACAVIDALALGAKPNEFQFYHRFYWMAFNAEHTIWSKASDGERDAEINPTDE